MKAGERESQRQELMIRGILEAFSSDLAAQQARETSTHEAPDLLACAKQAIKEFSPAFRERAHSSALWVLTRMIPVAGA